MPSHKTIQPSDLELSSDGVRIASLLFCMGFYADVPLSQMGPATIKMFEVFQSYCPKGALNYYITDTMNKHRAVNATALATLPTWLRRGGAKRDSIVITYQASEAFNAAPNWCFMVNGSEEPKEKHTDEASVIRIGFPASFGIDRVDEMDDLFAKFLALAKFRTARAGFAFLCSRYGDWEQEATEHAWSKSMRHPGADIVDMVNEVLTVGPDAIMGVDWLTFIDTEFVKRLGGPEVVKKSLKKNGARTGVDVSPIADGLLFRAGQGPQIGDVNRGDDLPEYRAVYQTLKPLMEVVYDRARSLSLEHDEEDRTLEWLKRHER